MGHTRRSSMYTFSTSKKVDTKDHCVVRIKMGIYERYGLEFPIASNEYTKNNKLLHSTMMQSWYWYIDKSVWSIAGL